MHNNILKFGMPTLLEISNAEETAKLCSELGLDFVELNMNLPEYQSKNLLNNIDKLNEIKDNYGIFYTLHLDENLDVANFNDDIRAAYLKLVSDTIVVAEKIDAKVIVMHMNHGIYYTIPEKRIRLYEQYLDFYLDCIQTYKDKCENLIADKDVKICIENTEGFFDFEKKAVDVLLQSKVFGLTWDIGHSNNTNNVDVPFIMERENKLRHFHVHDGLGTKDHRPLGTGEIDLKQRLEIAQKHNCTCLVETKTVDALKKSVAWLKENDYIK